MPRLFVYINERTLQIEAAVGNDMRALPISPLKLINLCDKRAILAPPRHTLQ